MNIELKGHKAIVTGSTAGIGRATAEKLARAGASVVINNSMESLQRVEGTLRFGITAPWRMKSADFAWGP